MGKGKEESRVRSEGASPRVVTAARCAARAVDRVAALSARPFRQGQKATAVTTAALVCCIRLAVGDNVFPPQSRPRRPHTNVGRRRRERPAGQRDERVARRRADRRRQRMCRRRRRAANNGCAHGSEKGERVTNHLADKGEASAPARFSRESSLARPPLCCRPAGAARVLGRLGERSLGWMERCSACTCRPKDGEKVARSNAWARDRCRWPPGLQRFRLKARRQAMLGSRRVGVLLAQQSSLLLPLKPSSPWPWLASSAGISGSISTSRSTRYTL